MRLVAMLGVAFVVAGCANAQVKRDFSRELNAGNIPGATEVAIKSAALKDEHPTELLWALEAGALLKASGLPECSNFMLDGLKT